MVAKNIRNMNYKSKNGIFSDFKEEEEEEEGYYTVIFFDKIDNKKVKELFQFEGELPTFELKNQNINKDKIDIQYLNINKSDKDMLYNHLINTPEETIWYAKKPVSDIIIVHYRTDHFLDHQDHCLELNQRARIADLLEIETLYFGQELIRGVIQANFATYIAMNETIRLAIVNQPITQVKAHPLIQAEEEENNGVENEQEKPIQEIANHPVSNHNDDLIQDRNSNSAIQDSHVAKLQKEPKSKSNINCLVF